jgi:hypothetical protein
MSINTQIHIEYLGEYVFKSIILEPAAHVEYLGEYVFKSIILEPVSEQLRESGESLALEMGHAGVFNKWK